MVDERIDISQMTKPDIWLCAVPAGTPSSGRVEATEASVQLYLDQGYTCTPYYSHARTPVPVGILLPDDDNGLSITFYEGSDCQVGDELYVIPTAAALAGPDKAP